MIQLTDAITGKPTMIKPSSIDGIAANHKDYGSVVRVDGQNYFVKEEPEDIRQILEASRREK